MISTQRDKYVFYGKAEAQWAYETLGLYLPRPKDLATFFEIEKLKAWCLEKWQEEEGHVCLCRNPKACSPDPFALRAFPIRKLRKNGIMYVENRVIARPGDWIVWVEGRVGCHRSSGYLWMEELSLYFPMGDVPGEFLECKEEVIYPGGRW